MAQETANVQFPLASELESKKDALKDEYVEYVMKHPELKQIMSDFLSKVLLDKPKDIPSYAHSYFGGFNKRDASNAPLIVCGPSGVGKGTLMKRFFAEFEGKVGISVSHTTRAPREGEVDGVHYHYVSKEEMEKEIEQNKFVEHAHVHNNIYGTSFESVKDVLNGGKVCVLEIDVQGAKNVKATDLNPMVLYIAPPSVEELESRLRSRGTESEESITTRMANAKTEMAWLETRGNADYTIVNDDLDRSYSEMRAKILEWYPDLKQ